MSDDRSHSSLLMSPSTQDHIQGVLSEDIESGLRSGVTVAPALFINGIRYTGRWNKAQLMAAIVAVSY